MSAATPRGVQGGDRRTLGVLGPIREQLQAFPLALILADGGLGLDQGRLQAAVIRVAILWLFLVLRGHELDGAALLAEGQQVLNRASESDTHVAVIDLNLALKKLLDGGYPVG